jgi:hypothetical protein
LASISVESDYQALSIAQTPIFNLFLNAASKKALQKSKISLIFLLFYVRGILNVVPYTLHKRLRRNDILRREEEGHVNN